MKNKRILILAAVVAVTVSCTLLAEALSLVEGKEAKVYVRVVDTEGNPVQGANIKAYFRFIDIGVLNEVEYMTDKDGRATVCGRCVDGVSFEVTKPGWYKGCGGEYFLTGDNDKPMPQYKNGKWLPYGTKQEIVLKKEIEPVPMLGEWSRRFDLPEANKDYGWDMECSDFVEPYGKGKVADFQVRISWEYNPDMGIKKAFVLTFPNCLDGYYIVDCDTSSYLSVPHKADPYAKYEKEYIQRWHVLAVADDNENKTDNYGPDNPYRFVKYNFNQKIDETLKEELPVTKVMIMRTRTKVDENGTLISAHYSMMRYGIMLESLHPTAGPRLTTYFNPYENNMSLEYSSEKTGEYYRTHKTY